MRVCLLIPAYNEAARIASVIEQARQFVPDVLVVDDGSTDETAEKARAVGAVVLRHAENRGKGHALRAGFHAAIEAGYDVLITLDGDGQHDPLEIPRFLDRLHCTGAAIIVGSRMEDLRAMPLHRRLNNRLVSAVGTWLSGQRVPDFQCGFRLLRTEVLRHVRLQTGGYETESELLIQAGRLGYRIETIPVRTIYAGQASHVRPCREMRRFTRLLFHSLGGPPRPGRPRRYAPS